MKITRHGGRIWMRDRVAPYWVLGLFLLAGGLIGIAMPLGLATNAGELESWERVTSLGVGVGVCAGALWWLARNPATEVQLDLTRRSFRLVRWGILGRQVRQVAFDQLESVQLEEGKDTDGDQIWRPVVRLRGGEVVRLSKLWSHDEAAVRAAAAAFAEPCRLPVSDP